MPVNPEPLVDDQPDGAPPASRRRPLLVIGVAVLALLAVAAGVFAVVRDDGASGGEETFPTVTFGPEMDATTLPEPPLGGRALIAINLDSGPVGTEITLQGTAFKQGKEFGPVELFWDRVGGEKLKTVDGPRFSVKLKIPADAPVLTEGHNIIAVQRDKDGDVVHQESARFYVLAPKP